MDWMWVTDYHSTNTRMLRKCIFNCWLLYIELHIVEKSICKEVFIAFSWWFSCPISAPKIAHIRRIIHSNALHTHTHTGCCESVQIDFVQKTIASGIWPCSIGSLFPLLPLDKRPWTDTTKMQERERTQEMEEEEDAGKKCICKACGEVNQGQKHILKNNIIYRIRECICFCM